MRCATTIFKDTNKLFANFTSSIVPAMKISILEFVEGAKQAKGLTVIIDVFRAFSVACYAFDAGASKIIATGDVGRAFELKTRYTNSILIGERHEKKIEGFDFGNSPTEILTTDLKNKVVIHTTTAGTNGLVNAANTDILTGSFVNAGAIVKYIRSVDPEEVTLVAMGYRARETADEDMLCARMIEAWLTGSDEDFEPEIAGLRHGAGDRFFRPENLGFSPPTDFFLCTMTDRFDFIIKAEKRADGNVDLIRTDL